MRRYQRFKFLPLQLYSDALSDRGRHHQATANSGSRRHVWADRLIRFAGVLLFLLVLGARPALADSKLAEFLAKVTPNDLVPGADRFGPQQGQPPVATALAGNRLLGYVYLNADWVNSTGYSGRPIQILIGLSTDARITGARLMEHHEPIVLIGIPPARIANFI